MKRGVVISVAIHLALVLVAGVALRRPDPEPDSEFELLHDPPFLVNPSVPRQDLFLETAARWEESLVSRIEMWDGKPLHDSTWEDREEQRWHEEYRERVAVCAWRAFEPSTRWEADPGVMSHGSYGDRRNALLENRSGRPRIRRDAR